MTAGMVLAAGRSRRMGSAKLVLPWGDGGTVVGSVVGGLQRAGFRPIIVVTGADGEKIEAALEGVTVDVVRNPDPLEGDMLGSIQAGLRALELEIDGVAILPGDMPRIAEGTLGRLARTAAGRPEAILAPVHGGRKGHPVVVPRRWWDEILGLGPGETLRTFLRRHEAEIVRIEVDDPGIHADLDTPQEYREAAD